MTKFIAFFQKYKDYISVDVLMYLSMILMIVGFVIFQSFSK